jgi:single-stranded DNA-binding protein
MSIDALISGTLIGVPAFKLATTGSRFCHFRIKTSDKNGETLFCSCITFAEPVIEALERLEDGAATAISGEASINTWHTSHGNLQVGLDVMVHLIQTPYHAGRKRGPIAKP